MSVKQVLTELQIHFQFRKKGMLTHTEMSYLFQCLLLTYIEIKDN